MALRVCGLSCWPVLRRAGWDRLDCTNASSQCMCRYCRRVERATRAAIAQHAVNHAADDHKPPANRPSTIRIINQVSRSPYDSANGSVPPEPDEPCSKRERTGPHGGCSFSIPSIQAECEWDGRAFFSPIRLEPYMSVRDSPGPMITDETHHAIENSSLCRVR